MKTLFFLAALAAAVPAAAHGYRAGTLHIMHPVLRVASPVSKTGAGYLMIMNSGKQADRLLSVSTPAATRADLHGTTAAGGVMQMRAQAGGVPLPAGKNVRFATGGLHVMFIGLKGPVPARGRVPVRLVFERAGLVDIEFVVEPVTAPAGGSASG